ncbi:hypothetical protein L596_001388 [Steinernema carpocapsae]|uniref:Uncharacterized protein n=1 Tax=Steinernema carpocapsae TaxID=34508 RepID=A0A4U8ULE7_STECR|nr:hypothetical protein L596_001388 [Steinernema carpocapsae]
MSRAADGSELCQMANECASVVENDETSHEKVEPSGIWGIIRFAREEWLMLSIALIGAIIRGLTFPIFSIIYGQMFKTLTDPTRNDELNGAVDMGSPPEFQENWSSGIMRRKSKRLY